MPSVKKIVPPVMSPVKKQGLEILISSAGAIGLVSFSTLLYKVYQTHNTTSFPYTWIILNMTAQLCALIYGLAYGAWGIYVPGIIFMLGLSYMLLVKMYSQDPPPNGGKANADANNANANADADANANANADKVANADSVTNATNATAQRAYFEDQLQRVRTAQQMEEPYGQKGQPKSVADMQPIPSNSNIQ